MLWSLQLELKKEQEATLPLQIKLKLVNYDNLLILMWFKILTKSIRRTGN